ncbi:CU044_5270 family protein [Nonomuraea sp. NN258]|uniref:CU044_5270 family protein n=1 Tax=Nonomuraea antri TaxID=2730852 RepID=UPI001569236D|nr:CU044_5270 family protein [Nonomuraea antri]NRQ32422.1 CU044_5270 family protein [Nonomuraea antri]
MSRKPDAMRLLTMARPDSLDRGSRRSADDLLVEAAGDSGAAAAPPRRRMTVVTGIRLAAVAMAVTVVTVVLVRNTGPETAASHPLSARTVLLAAADRIENTGAATGRYWHSVGQSMALGQEGRAPAGVEPKLVDYRVRCTHEVWMARSERKPSWLVVTAQSGEPLTAADEAIWRQQGAYRIGACQGPGVPSVGGVLPAAPFAMRLDDESAPEVSYPQVGPVHVTTEEVMTLPPDPVRLRSVLGEWARRGGYQAGEELLYSQAASLLSQLPTTPRVRAALYRMLAELPKVRNLGTVTDPLGRAGRGIELAGWQQLVIEESSGRLLAVQEGSGDGTGMLTSWTAVTSSGWTDADPRLPETS